MHHTCIRIYPNGKAKYTVRDEAGTEGWLKFNKEWRPGCALIVDGELVPETGDPADPELQALMELALSREIADPSVRRIGRQWDNISRQYEMRFPDDAILVSDLDGMEFVEEFRGKQKSSAALR